MIGIKKTKSSMKTRKANVISFLSNVNKNLPDSDPDRKNSPR